MSAETPMVSLSVLSRQSCDFVAANAKLRTMDEFGRFRRLSRRVGQDSRSGEREFVTFDNKARAEFA
jgi:hypothetical protein